MMVARSMLPNRATGVPDVAARTVGADTRRKVMLLLTIAYVIRTVAYLERDTKGDYTPERVTDALLRTNIPAWVVIYAVLAIASDFDATREVSIAFAILVLVAVLFYDGPRTLRTIEGWTQPKPASKGKASGPAGPTTNATDATNATGSSGGWVGTAPFQQKAGRITKR